VRPGIFLYGGTSIGAAAAPVRPRPVAALRTRVIGLRTLGAEDTVSYGATWTAGRTRRIATLAIGYADGVLRALSNRGMVELCGQVVPIVGRVTMDLTMVALPDSSSVAIGDVATVWGGAVSLESQALAAGTIPYELLTGLSGRVERRYNGGDA
jgi:alanine racemase